MMSWMSGGSGDDKIHGGAGNDMLGMRSARTVAVDVNGDGDTDD